MIRTQPGHVLRQIRGILQDQRAGQLSDRELLEHFVQDQDEEAFAVLVRRHGRLVLDVCRRVLRKEHDAEDAFQATFLVLARKAGSIRRQEAVGSWLYGVAYRIALKARTTAARRRQHERQTLNHPTADPLDELTWRELCQVLDEELSQLPAHCRTPLLLCYLEGRTQDEAARLLGWKKRTVKARLERGRNLLRHRLARRGLGLGVPLLTSALVPQVTAALPADLVDTAVRAAAGPLAAGALPTAVTELAAEVLRAGCVPKFNLAGALVLAAGMVVAGMGVVFNRIHAENLAAESDQEPRQMAREYRPQAAAAKAGIARQEDLLPAGALAHLGSPRFRHGANVDAVAFAPDGKTLAAAGGDRIVRIWEAATGKELHRLEGHRYRVSAVAYSADGTTLVSASDDYSIRVWDPATGKERTLLLGHKGRVLSIALAPDGKLLASAAEDETIRLWDMATGNELKRLLGHQGHVRAVAFAPNGKTLASAGADKTIRLWDKESGTELRRLEGHEGEVLTVAFAPEGRRLASGGEDKTIRWWDPSTGKETSRWEGHSWPVQSVCFSPKGEWLASAASKKYGSSGEIKLWEVGTRKELRSFRGHHNTVIAVAFAPDGKTLASGGADNCVRLWDCANGREISSNPGHQAPVVGAVFSPDGKILVTGSDDRTIRVWDASTRQELRQLSGHEGMVQALAFSPDGKHLASADREGAVRLWEVASGREIRRFSGPAWFHSVAFSPDGRLLAAGSSHPQLMVPPGTVWVWETANGKLIHRREAHQSAVRTVDFSPDGKWLASAGLDKVIVLCDAATGKEVRRLEGHQGTVDAVAFSPDSALLASGGHDHTVRFWEMATGKEVRQVKVPGDFCAWTCCSVKFSPDGKTLVVGGWQGVRLIEAATGGQRRVFAGHDGDARSVAFAPDGKAVVSAGGDATVLIWDVTGRLPVGGKRPAPLSPQQLEAAWDDLAADNSAKAYQAHWALVASAQQAVPFLEKKVVPATSVDGRRIARLIEELDDDQFTVREAASKALEKIGPAAEPAMRKTLENASSPEVIQRIKMLLEKMSEKGFSPDRVRSLRAIEVLEQVATPEARRVLAALAGGAKERPLTREAKASLARLAGR